MNEKIKSLVWRYTKGQHYKYLYSRTKADRKRLSILDSDATIDYILQHRCSVSRYGDGEFQIIDNYLRHLHGGDGISEVDTFQRYDSALAKRLYEVLQVPHSDAFIKGIPFALKQSSVFRGYSRTFFERESLARLSFLLDDVTPQTYCDTCFTRFYMERADIVDYSRYIKRLQSLWHDRDILFVEGEQSRLGVGNDLFTNARSIRRILCPATNAFALYDDILETTKRHAVGTDVLVLIALGQTATVLAYDLHLSGCQAIDVGHVDIEYEWYRIGAKSKVAIRGKYVNEAKETGGRDVENSSDSEYQSQIISVISGI